MGLKGAEMELLIAAVVGGVVLAIVMLKVIWSVVSRAVDNGLDWLILTFGNERSARQVEEKSATRRNP
jgi:hypothetical protein